ncbi:hypothetical protein ZWY2020_003796 [Hordeum vulgare]|nr:hypothetical protein ZWY2020_003796 [Hordeum vulgare]
MRSASLTLYGFLIFLNVFPFLRAVGAEQGRNTGKVVPDEYNERSYCLYDTDASTVYGVCAFFVLLLAGHRRHLLPLLRPDPLLPRLRPRRLRCLLVRLSQP